MDWLWLVKQPWFTVSPNIWSMTFYLICAIAGGRILLAHGAHYKKWPKLIAFTDGLFLIGMIVLIQDTGWMLFNTIRWYASYHDLMTFSGYWIRYPQNMVGLCLLGLLSFGIWKTRLASFTRHTVFWMAIIWFIMGVNFMLAPDPSWTDYTWAVRVQAPDWQIFFEFFLSHVVLKVLMGLSFLGLFRQNGMEQSSGTVFQSTYKESPATLSDTEEVESMGNAVKEWGNRTRIPGFRKGHPRKFCNAKGTKNPGGVCPDKKIGRAPKGNRGIYYVFCLARGECSCQSIYPKILRIPVLERLQPQLLKAVGRRR